MSEGADDFPTYEVGVGKLPTPTEHMEFAANPDSMADDIPKAIEF